MTQLSWGLHGRNYRFCKITFSSQNYIFESKLHFRVKITCSSQNYFFESKLLFRVKITFSSQYYFFESKLHFRVEITFFSRDCLSTNPKKLITDREWGLRHSLTESEGRHWCRRFYRELTPSRRSSILFLRMCQV